MPEYRRYRPRRSEASGLGFGRVLIVMVLLAGLVWLGKVWFFHPTNTTQTNSTSDISLVTDNANVVVVNATATANANTNTNSSTTTAAGWESFSVTQCPTAISTFGKSKRVVITVGLSAANEQTTQALAALKTSGVLADIFVSGSFAKNHPDTVKAFSSAGFPVYSQSYDGSDLAVKKDSDVNDAISSAETAITAATGTSPKPLFRPPQGSYTDKTLSVLHDHGYCTFLWTVDAYDWQADAKVETSQQRVLDALDKQTGGAIVALHAGYDVTPQLIPSLITALRDKGWTIVSAADALLKP
jgi:peptidoglycan/xylan/chitin deacetylase (PgdA/CDA1 family)